MKKNRSSTQEVYRTEQINQAIQKSRKSKTEENDNTPEALDQSIRVLSTAPLVLTDFFPPPRRF